MVGGKLVDNDNEIKSTVANDSGVFIPFSDLTGVLNTSSSEIGNAGTSASGPGGDRRPRKDPERRDLTPLRSTAQKTRRSRP